MDKNKDIDLGSQLEGDIIIPGFTNGSGTNNESSNGEFNTLDEPILDTIKRDLKSIGQKLQASLYSSIINPNNTNKNILLREWDIWGPLILCTYIGLLLQMIGGDSSGYIFTEVFVLVWVGIAALTYNFVFCFSATISTFQCVCVIGYCLGPLGISVTIFELLKIVGLSEGTFFLRFLITVLTTGWAAFAAIRILGFTIPVEKRYVVLGPVVIFYLLTSLLILYHS